MKKFSKKSAIEIQFNWIFVIIAGTVIFVFIISLILGQKKSLDTQVSQDVFKQLSTNIKGKQQLTNTFSQMEIPQTTLTFSCDSIDLTSDFKISGSQREQLPLEIIFAPKEFDTKTLNIWTLDFAVPFIVTRFIYITPPNMIFIIYNSSDSNQEYARTIYNSLPSNITKKYASTENELKSALKGYTNYRIICFDGSSNSCSLPNAYNYIQIIPDSASSNLFGYGIVKYTKGATASGSINYIGQASLFGAIFSDDEKYYKCEMDRAFKQFEIKRGLHFERVKLLEEDLKDNNPACIPIMALPRTTLTDMKDLKLINVTVLYAYMNQLRRDNTDLTFKGCPLIY
jgi:hypothetical protein